MFFEHCFPLLANSIKSYLHFIKPFFFLYSPRPFTSKSHVFRKSLTIDGDTRNRNLEEAPRESDILIEAQTCPSLVRIRINSVTSVAGGYTKFSNHPSITLKLTISNRKKKTSVLENHVFFARTRFKRTTFS